MDFGKFQMHFLIFSFPFFELYVVQIRCQYITIDFVRSLKQVSSICKPAVFSLRLSDHWEQLKLHLFRLFACFSGSHFNLFTVVALAEHSCLSLELFHSREIQTFFCRLVHFSCLYLDSLRWVSLLNPTD